jgi:3D (Asp-Asp-Asp) domain-containing protein
LCTGKPRPDCITKSGLHAEQNVTAACDPKHLGDLVYIDTIGLRFCEDVGSAIKGNRVDLYFKSHEEAKKFGRKKRRGVFIETPTRR